MNKKQSVGIKGIGTYLPETIRKNNAWSQDIVDTWKSRLSKVLPRDTSSAVTVTAGVERVMKALENLNHDPFQGSKERRIIAPGELPSDMATKAAQDALKSIGLGADKIDLLLSHAMIPDYICVNGASIIHDKLGLRPEVPGFTIDTVCASFLAQFQIAQSLISVGQANRALLTQASNCTLIMPMEQPYSAWAGDAASAVIVEPVDDGLGLLATAFRTNGSMNGGFVATVPGKRWYEEGHVVACNVDKLAARRMQLEVADQAKEVVDDALAQAGISKKEVAFFAGHQASAWMVDVCQEYCELDHAKSLNTFAWTGGLANVNVPLQLAIAHKEGLIKKGDVVAMFMMSAGMMTNGAVMRWAM